MLSGTAVFTRSKKQPTVADSTTASELISAHATAQRIVMIRKLLEEISVGVMGATTLYCDNESTVKIINNRTGFEKVKHVDVKLAYLRELIDLGIIVVEWIPTQEMVADIFTKGLGKNKFMDFRKALGLVTIAKLPGSVDNAMLTNNLGKNTRSTRRLHKVTLTKGVFKESIETQKI